MNQVNVLHLFPKVQITIALALLAGLLFCQAALAADTSYCDRFASPAGSDRNAGTRSAPFATAQKLTDALRPGQIGCLRGGHYTEADGNVSVKTGGTGESARKIVQNYPGEKATICARISLPDGTNHVTFRADALGNLTLDGTCAPRSPDPTNRGRYNSLASPYVLGDFNAFVRVDVHKDIRRYAGGGYTDAELEKTGVCFILGQYGSGAAANGTLIRDSAVHHCGVTERMWDGGPDNHGIYASRSVGGRLEGNLVYGNGERGIQLYPDSDGNTLSKNILYGNYQNINVGDNPDANTIRANILANPRNSGANFTMSSVSGSSGNEVNGNCTWPTEGIETGPGVTEHGNLNANPLLVNVNTLDMAIGLGSSCSSRYPVP